MRKLSLLILLLVLPSVLSIVAYFTLKPKPVPTDPKAIGQAVTLAGNGEPALLDGTAQQSSFSDPFGIAVDSQSSVYVADGGESNRIRRIKEGKVETIAGSTEGFADGKAMSAQFNTPSGLCIGRRGLLIIADTGNNRIRMIDTQGQVTTVAGTGETGYKDGPGAEAQFDSPLGVAVDEDGIIYVADTYNDCIRKINKDGEVSTIAGKGSPGLSDGYEKDAAFDTPCGIVVDKNGNLFVADAGNDAIRKITPQGEVTTFAGGLNGRGDGVGTDAGFDRPTGIAITQDGFLFVTDQDGGRIRRITPEGEVTTYAGLRSGFADQTGDQARFNSPAGIAVDRNGEVYVADSQNYLIRKISPVSSQSTGATSKGESEKFIQPGSASEDISADKPVPRIDLTKLSVNNSFPWPLAPQDGWHEVTGVVGEARGAPGGVALHHLHSGLDMRGNMGDPVLSARSEKVSSPIPNWGYNGSGEGIQVGLISYIHIRVGRDIKDQIGQPEKFKPRFDQSGQLIGIRVRRGTRFKLGDIVGTLNRLYHVHMNIGPWNAQANPIGLPFPGLKDTIAPTIEPNGIEIVDSSGKRLTEKRDGRLVVSGDVDILVAAFDRADGNNASRKLGIYRLGYQLLKEDNSAVTGFEQPLINIDFSRMPPGDESVFVAYADGSGVSAYGTPTKFKYIATNLVRDGKAVDGFLRTKAIEPGNYLLKILAEDFAGNRATGPNAEVKITIPAR
jgi:sugar lactone lactonase YvrE